MNKILILDYGTLLCLGRAFKRSLLYPLKGRPDVIEGCPERLLALDFYHYILRFRMTSRPRIERAYRQYGDRKTLLRFRNPAALERWLAALDRSRNGER